MKGMNLCLNCGSPNYWSRECKFWVKKPFSARTRLAIYSWEELEEIDEHEDTYLEMMNENDEESKN